MKKRKRNKKVKKHCPKSDKKRTRTTFELVAPCAQCFDSSVLVEVIKCARIFVFILFLKSVCI